MPKHKRAVATPVGEVIPAGLLVDEPEDLCKPCKKAIEKALNQKNLGFNGREVAGKEGRRSLYSLVGDKATSAEEKYHYKVIPFIERRSRIYWLAVSLEFILENLRYRLASVSIFVFAGNANDERKIPLMRAEWACLPTDIDEKHAQPHWHIYPSQIGELVHNQNGFDPDPEVQIFAPEEEIESEVREFGEQSTNAISDHEDHAWEGTEHFHFAMAARWREGEDVELNDSGQLEIDNISNWLLGCIRYTYVQFEYLYKS